MLMIGVSEAFLSVFRIFISNFATNKVYIRIKPIFLIQIITKIKR